MLDLLIPTYLNKENTMFEPQIYIFKRPNNYIGDLVKFRTLNDMNSWSHTWDFPCIKYDDVSGVLTMGITWTPYM